MDEAGCLDFKKIQLICAVSVLKRHAQYSRIHVADGDSTGF
jgi:hypothetical protein